MRRRHSHNSRNSPITCIFIFRIFNSTPNHEMNRRKGEYLYSTTIPYESDCFQSVALVEIKMNEAFLGGGLKLHTKLAHGGREIVIIRYSFISLLRYRRTRNWICYSFTFIPFLCDNRHIATWLLFWVLPLPFLCLREYS